MATSTYARVHFDPSVIIGVERRNQTDQVALTIGDLDESIDWVRDSITLFLTVSQLESLADRIAVAAYGEGAVIRRYPLDYRDIAATDGVDGDILTWYQYDAGKWEIVYGDYSGVVRVINTGVRLFWEVEIREISTGSLVTYESDDCNDALRRASNDLMAASLVA